LRNRQALVKQTYTAQSNAQTEKDCVHIVKKMILAPREVLFETLAEQAADLGFPEVELGIMDGIVAAGAGTPDPVSRLVGTGGKSVS
jgi:hypothetical protein